MRECSEELLGEIARRLTAALHPSRVYLFGSQARGDADGDSDLDLLVVVPDTDTPPRELARLGRKSLWGMCIPVDIVVCTDSELAKWSQVRCNVIHTAVEKGRLLFAS
ncbi:MAG: nucleotidyltransferase domain-containing protein [Planctomycetes bacterium]|nr:nucleotidyltransferase domain-containing protein [Planctomycetota bacterium]